MITDEESKRRSSSCVPSTYWERVAQTKWGAYISEVERRLILSATQQLPKPTHALEVGCEGGRWSKLLAEQGWQMTCIDINPDSLARCQSKLPSATCILTDSVSRKIPCESGAFDLLLCIEVAPVVNSDWFLTEAYRVLRPHGCTVIVTWNTRSLRGLAARIAHKLARRDGSFYRSSYSSWRAQLRTSGFVPVHEVGLCWGPFDRSSNSNMVPLFAKLERLLNLHRLPSFSPWVALVAKRSP